LQAVTYYGIEPNTRFAFVCVEADYLLKQLALGLFKSPVAKVESYCSLVPHPEKAHRFSLESDYEALLVSPDGTSFELRGASLKVNGDLLRRLGQKGGMSASAKQFVTQCNANFAELSQWLDSWADLSNLSDLAVLAALMTEDDLPRKAAWDLSWVLDPKGYAVTPMSAPKAAQTLCNYDSSGKMLIFTSGGIVIDPATWTRKRDYDTEGKLESHRRRAGGDVVTPSRKNPQVRPARNSAREPSRRRTGRGS
jgi:hypothetical protein